MDRRIKFRHLDTLSAIARNKSLKGAAEQLGLSQPAVSKTLRELEEITGVTLMDRDRSGIRLTPQGKVFLQFAEQSTAALRHGLHSVRGSAGAGRAVRIGALPTIAGTLLPRALQQLDAGALIEVDEGPHHSLTARLRSGELDLTVGRLGSPASMQGLAFRQLYTEEVVFVARADSPARDIRQFVDLDKYLILYPPQNSAIRPLVARLLIAAGVPLFSRRIESASASFGRAMVLDDPGLVWVISRGVVARDLDEGTLVCLPLDSSATSGAVGIMTRADEELSTEARLVIRAIVKAAGA